MADLSISIPGSTPADQLANASRALGDNTDATLLAAAMQNQPDPVQLVTDAATASKADLVEVSAALNLQLIPEGADNAARLAATSQTLGDATDVSLIRAALAIQGDPAKLVADTVTAANSDPCTTLQAAGAALGVRLTVPVTPDPLDAYFPADPNKALFPSPEGSTLGAARDVTTGKWTISGYAATVDGSGSVTNRSIPYLVDMQGRKIQLGIDPTADLSKESGVRLYVNGVVASDSGYVDPIIGLKPWFWRPAKMQLAQGEVQFTDQIRQNFWCNGIHGIGIEAAWVPLKQSVPPQVVAPAIQPGSSGQVVTAGPGGQYSGVMAALAAVSSGATIKLVGGATAEAVTLDSSKNVLLDGGASVDRVGKAVTSATGWFDQTSSYLANTGRYGGRYALDKGQVVVRGGSHAFKGLQFLNIAMSTKFGGAVDTGGGVVSTGMGAIWLWNNQPSGTTSVITVQNCYFEACQNAFISVKPMGDSTVGPDALLMNNVWINKCGLGDGQSHGMYDTVHRTQIDGLLVTAPNNGHAVKCESADFVMRNFDIEAWGAAPINLAYGSFGNMLIADGVVRKPAVNPFPTNPIGALNSALLTYGNEPITVGTGGVTLYRVTFQLDLDNCGWLWPVNGTLMLVDCLFPNKQPASFGSQPGRFIQVP